MQICEPHEGVLFHRNDYTRNIWSRGPRGRTPPPSAVIYARSSSSVIFCHDDCAEEREHVFYWFYPPQSPKLHPCWPIYILWLVHSPDVIVFLCCTINTMLSMCNGLFALMCLFPRCCDGAGGLLSLNLKLVLLHFKPIASLISITRGSLSTEINSHREKVMKLCKCPTALTLICVSS